MESRSSRRNAARFALESAIPAPPAHVVLGAKEEGRDINAACSTAKAVDLFLQAAGGSMGYSTAGSEQGREPQ
jgi:hypothetical protein